MNPFLSRREFLKIAGLLSLSLATPDFLYRPAQIPGGSGQNVLIVVFDALSAYHVSLLGYPRQTMPKLSRLAEKATVYHQHYANGPFTTPGTASLLTGALPFTHRALNHNDTVAEAVLEKSIFHAFGGYHRMAYSHNPLVNTLLKQFLPAIDDLTPQGRLFLEDDEFLHNLFGNDEDAAALAWTRFIKQGQEGHSYSLFLARLYQALKRGRFDTYLEDFPRGLPNIYDDTFFILEHAIDWLQDLMLAAPQPFLGYFHFLPPHFPYKTRRDFYDAFARDGFEPPEKPDHLFALERAGGKVLEWRRWYDEYLLYVDSEFARLYDFMQSNGLLENTWLVLSSDHGELFERGIVGHQTPVLYEPGVRIPLVIFAPGQAERQDVYAGTSAIDLLPTLMHVTGQPIPAWAEGSVLPPFAADPPPGQLIYCLRGKGAEKGQPIHKGSAMIRRGPYKLIYIFGYEKDLPGGESVELFDVEADPEEMNDLAHSNPALVAELLPLLKTQLARPS